MFKLCKFQSKMFDFSGKGKKTGWPESQIGIEPNNIYNKRKQNNGNLQAS